MSTIKKRVGRPSGSVKPPTQPISRFTIGAVLRKIRVEKGLTQLEVSRLAGLEREMISMMETGKRTKSLEALTKVSAALETKVSDLFKQCEEMGSYEEILERIKLKYKQS